MTIAGWVTFVGVVIAILFFSFVAGANLGKGSGPLCAAVAAAAIVLVFLGMRWYFTSTASGVRALTDQKSELSNGLNRTVTVYTANGDIIAQYQGIIDIKDSDGGYVLFDFEGKRYTYYNCFVESIADTK